MPVLATAAFLHRALFTSGIFGARDIQRVYYPLKAYWLERIRAGELPEWYPYDALGQSYVGMIISGTFHPFNLSHLALGLTAGLTACVFFSFVAAFVGGRLLARRLEVGQSGETVAGVLFAFNGYLVSTTSNLLYLMAAATLPFAFWAIDHVAEHPRVARVPAAAVLLALVLFAGDALSFVVGCGLAPVFFAARHRPGRVVREVTAVLGLWALTAGVAAAQWLPALAIREDVAVAQQPLSTAVEWSTHPLRFLEVALGPLFAGEMGTRVSDEIARWLLRTGKDQLWADSLFLGLPALVLAAAGLWALRRKRPMWWFAGATVLLWVLALGKFGGLYALVHRLVPFWRAFRYPEKLTPFVFLALALAAALGVRALEREESLRRGVTWAAAIAGCVALLLGASELLLGAVSVGLFKPLWQGTPSPAALERLSSATAHWALTSGAACLGLAGLLRTRPGLRAAGVPLLLFVLLFAGNENVYVLVTDEVVRSPTTLVQAIWERTGSPKLGGPRVFGASGPYALPRLSGATHANLLAVGTASALAAVTPAHFGLEGANTYLPAASTRVWRLATLAPACPLSCSAALGARFLVFSAALRPVPEELRSYVVSRAPMFKLYLIENRLTPPRAHVVPTRCVASEADVLSIVRDPDFDASKEAVVECSGGEATISAGRASVTSYTPEQVEVEVVSPGKGMLVLADAFASGWTATIDGQPAAILRANYAVRAVEIPAGRHDVVFRYRAPGLRWGLLWSGLSLGLSASVPLLTHRKSRREKTATAAIRNAAT